MNKFGFYDNTMKNKIYSLTEYVAQGFSEDEAPLVKKHDILFNMGDNKTKEQKAEMLHLADVLGL